MVFWDSDTDSDAPEQTHPTQADLVRSHRGRHVVPRRDGELPATVPTSQTPEQVPVHVVDALQEDLDPRHAPRFPRCLSCLFRTDLLLWILQ